MHVVYFGLQQNTFNGQFSINVRKFDLLVNKKNKINFYVMTKKLLEKLSNINLSSKFISKTIKKKNFFILLVINFEFTLRNVKIQFKLKTFAILYNI